VQTNTHIHLPKVFAYRLCYGNPQFIKPCRHPWHMHKSLCNAIGDVPCTLHLTVYDSFAVDVDFVHCGKPFTFKITKWSGRGSSLLQDLQTGVPNAAVPKT